MTIQAVNPTRPLAFGFAIVVIGVLVAIGTMLGLILVRPMVLGLAFGGLILLVPTLFVRDQRAYWLFVLVLSIPFDIYKRTTTWLVEPPALFQEYGLPPSGTLSLDLYLTDAVLLLMLLAWFVRLCLRQDRLYFPNIGYIYVLYLAWALIVAMIEATSLYLSIFEWCRDILYFLSFIYLINNIVTRTQVRAVVLALFVGLVIESATVIAFFDLDIGTETYVYSGVYREQAQSSASHTKETATAYENYSGPGSQTKRSAGTFAHPAGAAYYLEYILPIVLSFLVTAGRVRDRLLLGALFGAGWVALYLTFSRAGLLSLFCGNLLYFVIARWSGLISRRAFTACALVFAVVAAVASPLLIKSLVDRPQSITKRLELNQRALATYWERPIFGAGLNNSSAVTEGSRSIVRSAKGGREVQVSVVHNHYLIVLTEVGLGGFLLYFTFFGQIGLTAFRHMRAGDREQKVLLAGAAAALMGIAIHNFGDPFGSHAVQAMLWLLAGLIVAIARRVRAEHPLPAPAHSVAATR